MVLKKANHVPIEISGGLQTIAIRVPNQLKLLGLMKQHHLALVAPSANPHKKLSPTKAEHVYKSLYGRIPAVLDGGSCKVGLESTILDLTQGYPIILRKGPITKDDLEKILGTDVIDPISHSIPSPGNMHLHYQPYTKSYLVQKSEFENTIKQHLNKPVGFLHYSFYQSLVHHPYSIKLEEIKENYASALYSSLHHLDSLNLSAIYIEAPPTEPKWGAVQDRLIKATNSF